MGWWLDENGKDCDYLKSKWFLARMYALPGQIYYARLAHEGKETTQEEGPRGWGFKKYNYNIIRYGKWIGESAFWVRNRVIAEAILKIWSCSGYVYTLKDE